MNRCCPSCGRENDITSSFCAFCGSTLAEAYTDLTELLPREEQAGYANARFPLASNISNLLDEWPHRSLTPSLASQGASVPSYPVERVAYDPYAQGASGPTSGPYPLSEGLPVPVAPENQPRRRGWGEALIGALLYLWGAFLSLFGVGGLLFQMPSTVMAIFVLGAGACELVLLPLVLIYYRHPHLRLGKRLLFEGLTLLVGFLLLLIAAAIEGLSEPLAYFAMGMVCLLYGVVTMVLAFW
ncbi:MAG: zinc ribbon domain-containing protein [Thermogemmatispora sp.]|uniref:zinc ribbon domain-containing protein n=1 Tax=Thermogemmatispora sp. TaxID=1968838 RepID=UPI0026142E99|nr:zinc ribbon domain-containing protein [Thermogemmatispora sp.]MBX5456497.1 zinc ribbon domain-containing protein [Thermogemmatispora sp.]